MSVTWLAIDGGQSGSRARASWTDREAAAPGYSHHNGGVASLLETLDVLIESLDPPAPIETIAIGHTGLPVSDVIRAQFAERVRGRSGGARVVLAPDEVTAHIGALGGQPGVVVAAGTGSVTLGVARDGSAARVDGWGFMFGDAGSAFAIGRAGLDHALRIADGRAESGALLPAAQNYFGADLRLAAWELYSEPRAVDIVARFAPDLIRCAEDGDAAATGIVRKAGRELALSARAGAQPLAADPVVAVSVTGRLMQPGGMLETEFRSQLAELLPSASVREPLGGPLDGAVILARDDIGIHHHLIYQTAESTTR